MAEHICIRCGFKWDCGNPNCTVKEVVGCGRPECINEKDGCSDKCEALKYLIRLQDYVIQNGLVAIPEKLLTISLDKVIERCQKPKPSDNKPVTLINKGV